MTSTHISMRRRKQMASKDRKRKRMIQSEIARQQRNPNAIIPYASFSRLVREDLQQYGEKTVRSNAMRALQCAAEQWLTEVFHEAQRVADYQKRDTIIPSDIHFVVPAEQRLPPTPAADEDEEESGSPLCGPDL